MQIEYVDEVKPLGTSGPLANVEGLENTFLVTNGDVLTDLDLNDLMTSLQKRLDKTCPNYTLCKRPKI
jgi:NDP-sugar pyrophosphorylase family protein